MIVVKISDGLGNQMFQYALGRSIAIKRDETLKMDISAFNKNYKLRNYLLEKYNIVYLKPTVFESIIYSGVYKYVSRVMNKLKLNKIFFLNIYKEERVHEFYKEVFTVDCNYFFGYWQDFRYFKEIRTALLKELTLKERLNVKNQDMLKKINTTNSVSIHVRRGDYLSIDGQDVCSLEYYKKAIEYITSLVSNPIFFIFSDDISWTKKNLYIENPTKYIDFNSANPEYDLELMRNCKHNIIANSTFSWWGAWLNDNEDKIIIGPKEWKIGVSTPVGYALENWVLL